MKAPAEPRRQDGPDGIGKDAAAGWLAGIGGQESGCERRDDGLVGAPKVESGKAERQRVPTDRPEDLCQTGVMGDDDLVARAGGRRSMTRSTGEPSPPALPGGSRKARAILLSSRINPTAKAQGVEEYEYRSGRSVFPSGSGKARSDGMSVTA